MRTALLDLAEAPVDRAYIIFLYALSLSELGDDGKATLSREAAEEAFSLNEEALHIVSSEEKQDPRKESEIAD